LSLLDALLGLRCQGDVVQALDLGDHQQKGEDDDQGAEEVAGHGSGACTITATAPASQHRTAAVFHLMKRSWCSLMAYSGITVTPKAPLS